MGDAQIGLEGSPDEYVAQMVAVFREVRRVLRKDGTVWLNLGDSYARAGGWSDNSGLDGLKRGESGRPMSNIPAPGSKSQKLAPRLKEKDLVGIPWRVALALQADDWWLRSDIIWAKGVSFCPTYSGSVMPESVTDRPTQSYEHVFLLAKSKRYYYDNVAVQEKGGDGSDRWGGAKMDLNTKKAFGGSAVIGQPANRPMRTFQYNGTRNLRSVWTINPKPYRGAHFACYPPALIEPMIKAGSSERGCCPCGAPWLRVVEKTGKLIQHHWAPGTDSKTEAAKGKHGSTSTLITGYSQEKATIGWQPTCTCGEEVDSGALDPNMGTGIDIFQPYEPIPCTVLDPFSGAGTTGLVADRLGRNAILIDLNPDYCQMAYDRIKGETPMFTEVILE